MPFDPPPRMPSLAERWHMERQEEEFRLAAAQREHEERVWWESLSDEERQAVLERRARELAEEQRRNEEARRAAEAAAAAHRARILTFESSHGGRASLDEARMRASRELGTIKSPEPLSPGGTLFVMMVAALIPGALIASITHSYGVGLIIAEALTVGGWAVWMQSRWDRRNRIRALRVQLAALDRRQGCGDVKCQECYPNGTVVPVEAG